MTQNRVNWVVSSFDSMYSRKIDTVLHKKLWIKSCYIYKKLCEYCQFLWFWLQTVPILQDQNVSICADFSWMAFWPRMCRYLSIYSTDMCRYMCLRPFAVKTSSVWISWNAKKRSNIFCWRSFFPLPIFFIATLEGSTKPF